MVFVQPNYFYQNFSLAVMMLLWAMFSKIAKNLLS